MSTLTISRRDRKAEVLAEIAAEVRRLGGDYAEVINQGHVPRRGIILVGHLRRPVRRWRLLGSAVMA